MMNNHLTLITQLEEIVQSAYPIVQSIQVVNNSIFIHATELKYRVLAKVTEDVVSLEGVDKSLVGIKLI